MTVYYMAGVCGQYNERCGWLFFRAGFSRNPVMSIPVFALQKIEQEIIQNHCLSIKTATAKELSDDEHSAKLEPRDSQEEIEAFD